MMVLGWILAAIFLIAAVGFYIAIKIAARRELALISYAIMLMLEDEVNRAGRSALLELVEMTDASGIEDLMKKVYRTVISTASGLAYQLPGDSSVIASTTLVRRLRKLEHGDGQAAA